MEPVLLIRVVPRDRDRCVQEQGAHHPRDHGVPAADSGLESGTCFMPDEAVSKARPFPVAPDPGSAFPTWPHSASSRGGGLWQVGEHTLSHTCCWEGQGFSLRHLPGTLPT